MQEWIQTKVAPHKFLRGGVCVIDVVPKRSVVIVNYQVALFADEFGMVLVVRPVKSCVGNCGSLQKQNSGMPRLSYNS